MARNRKVIWVRSQEQFLKIRNSVEGARGWKGQIGLNRFNKFAFARIGREGSCPRGLSERALNALSQKLACLTYGGAVQPHHRNFREGRAEDFCAEENRNDVAAL